MESVAAIVAKKSDFIIREYALVSENAMVGRQNRQPTRCDPFGIHLFSPSWAM